LVIIYGLFYRFFSLASLEMGSKVSKPAAAPSASANTGAGTGLTQLAASTPSVAPAAAAPATAAPAALETISEVTNAQQIQRGSRIRVLKDSRTRARMRRNRNHRSHRRQRNRYGSRSRK
jgi:hypothetical protein